MRSDLFLSFELCSLSPETWLIDQHRLALAGRGGMHPPVSGGLDRTENEDASNDVGGGMRHRRTEGDGTDEPRRWIRYRPWWGLEKDESPKEMNRIPDCQAEPWKHELFDRFVTEFKEI